ncbi:hypothetical protein PRIC1_004493 [Phytophthora ramorum]
MPGKTASKRPASKKPALQRAKELSNAKLEEGDHWFAVAMPWWEEFQACQKAESAPSVRNDSLVDKQLSSKTRKVAMLKPNLDEGSDFEFVSEAAWDVIAQELGFDWEIRREVIYQRSQQLLQIEPYPFVFKISCWTSEEAEPKELVDEANSAVVVLGSRTHTLAQLLSEVWLSTTDAFRHHFPQLLSCVDAASASSDQVRVCYRRRRAGDGELEWTPIQNMVKRSRLASISLRLKPRVKKRRTSEQEDESGEDQQGAAEDDEAEYDEHSGDRNEFGATLSAKLGDLRLDNRSEEANGTARLHEILVEQRAKGAGEFGWPSQGGEWQWRMALVRGDLLDALDTMKTWCEARVLAARRNKVHVHYRGWESKYDEWISRVSPRIAPPHSHISKWRSALREHTLVQIGIQVPHRQHPKWRTATVLEVAASSGSEQDTGDDDGSGLRVHVQVDGDDLWLPAHDDMLSQVNTHCESKPLTQDERQLLAHDDSLAASEAEEGLPVEIEGTGDGEQEDEEGDDDTIDVVDHEGSSSPPLRPSRANNAAVEVTTASRSGMDLRARVGPARNLAASFNQAQDQGRSSAGRTPARGRGRSRQVSSDDTSPETVSPTPRPNAGQVNTLDLQTLWTQVGNDLRSLQSSWDRLGESLVAFTQSLGD